MVLPHGHVAERVHSTFTYWRKIGGKGHHCNDDDTPWYYYVFESKPNSQKRGSWSSTFEYICLAVHEVSPLVSKLTSRSHPSKQKNAFQSPHKKGQALLQREFSQVTKGWWSWHVSAWLRPAVWWWGPRGIKVASAAVTNTDNTVALRDSYAWGAQGRFERNEWPIFWTRPNHD